LRSKESLRVLTDCDGWSAITSLCGLITAGISLPDVSVASPPTSNAITLSVFGSSRLLGSFPFCRITRSPTLYLAKSMITS
jgi:hypothetical protein